MRSIHGGVISILVLLFFALVPQFTFAEDLGLSEDVGYYIGSFDPPTLGHKAVAVETLKKFRFKKLYITVNWNTDKDFNLSVDERIEMLRLLFAEFGDRVEILREPLEGRQEFARYLNTKHDGKIIGIFGDDTYDKNFKIFNGIENFDFAKVERPVARAMLESMSVAAYEPQVHPIEVDADGLSSSLARDLIAQGKDASHVLSSDVMELIRKKGYYQPVPAERRKADESEFFARFQAFAYHFGYSGFEPPKFKPGQSRQAQDDKFIRWAITQKKMSVEEQLVFRPEAEQLLGYSSRTKSLRSSMKAGIYYGSFDFPTLGQKEVIAESIRQLKLDVLYVAPLESSPKDLNASLRERQEMLRLLVAEFGSKVKVLPSAPEGKRLARFVEQIANEHSEPTVAIFGENVFQKNHDLLRKVPRLKFAVVPRPGNADAAMPTPEGVAVVKTSLHDIPSALGSELPPLEALSPEVRNFVEKNNLYKSRTRAEFIKRYRLFIEALQKRLPTANFSVLGEPPFKPTQSLEGQADKFIQWVSRAQIPGTTSAQVRAQAEHIIGFCLQLLMGGDILPKT